MHVVNIMYRTFGTVFTCLSFSSMETTCLKIEVTSYWKLACVLFLQAPFQYIPFLQVHNMTAVATPASSITQGTTIITTVHD